MTAASGSNPGNKNPVSDEDRTRKRWEHRLEWWKAGVGTATLIAAVVYTVVSCNQWEEVVRSVDESKRSANAAHGQLALMNKERRAWAIAGTTLDKYTFEADKEVRINFLIKNIGKIPASGASANVTVAVFPWPILRLPKALHTDTPPEPTISIKYENMFIGPSDFAIPTAVFKVGVDVARDIPMGSKTLVLFGRITYTDESDTKGDTGFCRAYDPKSKLFHFCPTVSDWAK